jgi:7-cyano-7-deazaguanine synthase
MRANGRADTSHPRAAAGRPAVVLLLARRDGYEVHALTIDYGQRNAVELDAARAIAAAQSVVRHVVATVDLGLFGGSSLTADLDIPKAGSFAERNTDPVANTYVPARNTIFLALALGWAETLDADDIFMGVHYSERSGYPDTRPEFIAAFERLARVATNRERATVVHTPFIHEGWDKRRIIRLGLELGVDYALTRTCFDPSLEGAACGHCDACLLRLQGFAHAGVEDPVPYLSKGAV